MVRFMVSKLPYMVRFMVIKFGQPGDCVNDVKQLCSMKKLNGRKSKTNGM